MRWRTERRPKTEADEPADFVTTVAKASGIGVQAVKARRAKERRKREEASEGGLRYGGRRTIDSTLPGTDGESRPTTNFLDQVLASDCPSSEILRQEAA